MNQTQRKFLIDKIKEANKAKKEILRKSKPEKPSLDNYLLHNVMSNTFELQSIESIKEYFRQKALSLKRNDSFLKDNYRSSLLEISIPVDKLFVLQEEYENLVQKCEKEIDRINREIYEIEEAEKLLELRIQLASPKQLQKLIGEVDSFGELSLFDMKLKQLSPE